MTRARVALLALCTLLVGAGIGYGASHMGGSSGSAAAQSTTAEAEAAVSVSTTQASGLAAFAACRKDETFGCYQRAVPRDRRLAESGRGAR